MAMFPALMNDTMFSDLFDDPFFELALRRQQRGDDPDEHDEYGRARERQGL